jgi:hypothetical protein
VGSCTVLGEGKGGTREKLDEGGRQRPFKAGQR